jgi:hypothetical protein
LAKLIQQRFFGKQTSVDEVRKFVEEGTAFIAKQMRKALTLLETENKIKVEALKSDGRKRRKGTFSDDVILVFS